MCSHTARWVPARSVFEYFCSCSEGVSADGLGPVSSAVNDAELLLFLLSLQECNPADSQENIATLWPDSRADTGRKTHCASWGCCSKTIEEYIHL